MGSTIGGVGNNNSAPDLKVTVSGNNGAPQVETVEGEVQDSPMASARKISQQTMGQVLEQLGLPDTPANQQLAKALLEYNLPLDKETLKELGRLLKQLGGESEENVSLLAFLKSKGIPLNKELVQTIKHFLGEKNLANLLTQSLPLSAQSGEADGLAQLLNKLAPQEREELVTLLKNFKGEQPLAKDGAERIRQLLQKLGLENPEISAPELEVLLLQEGKPEEAPAGKLVQLRQQLEEGLKSQKEQLQQLGKTLQEMPKELLEKLPAQLREVLTRQLKENTGEPQKFIQSVLKNLEELPKEVLEKLPEQLKELLAKGNLPEKEKLLLSKLTQQLEELSKNSPEKFLANLREVLEQLPKEVAQKLLTQENIKSMLTEGKVQPESLNKLVEQLKNLGETGAKASQILQNLIQENPQLEKETQDLVKIFKGLTLKMDDFTPEEMVQNLKKIWENKQEILQGKNPFSGEQLTGNEKENLTKLWSDLKGSLETESLLKYYQIPVSVQEKLHQAALKVNPEGKSGSDGQGEGERLVIFLQTENLGQIKIDFTAQEQSLAFRFGVEEDEIKAELEDNFPDLTERLEALGYQIKEVNCSITTEKPEESYLEMEKKVILSGFRRIDLLT